jgi:hypothetical protein
MNRPSWHRPTAMTLFVLGALINRELLGVARWELAVAVA